MLKFVSLTNFKREAEMKIQTYTVIVGSKICNASCPYCVSKMTPGLGKFLRKNGAELMRLMHGAIVYDVDGQNICFSTCLTPDPSLKELRQLIFFPDGHLRYDWQYPGAILL